MANVPNTSYSDQTTERRARQLRNKRRRHEMAVKTARQGIGCAVLCAALLLAEHFGLMSGWLAYPIVAITLLLFTFGFGGACGYCLAKEEGDDEWKS